MPQPAHDLRFAEKTIAAFLIERGLGLGENLDSNVAAKFLIISPEDNP
jgi:hypothetical protein